MHLLTAARHVSREAVTLVPLARSAGARYGGHVMPDVTSTTDYVIKCICVCVCVCVCVVRQCVCVCA